MIEETGNEVPGPTDAPAEEPKRKGGWPRGKSRAAAKAAPETASKTSAGAFSISRLKARPNWENDDFRGVGHDGVDRLRIPDDIIQAAYRDGTAFQWVTKSVRGMETPQELAKMTQGGWTPVNQLDFEALNGMFMAKGVDDVITVDDCMLVARPVGLHQKAKSEERRDAVRPLRIAEEQLGHGIPNVTGSAHPTVRNSVTKTMERIEIPD